MTFRVGQRIQCFRDFNCRETFLHVTFPTVGSVYTVRDIVEGTHADGSKGIGLHLEEIVNVIGPFGIEYNFGPSRFRPLIERKTSIAIFTAMLTPQGVDA